MERLEPDMDAGHTLAPPAERSRRSWRGLVIALWLVLLGLAGYAYLAQRDLLSAQLAGALSLSSAMGAVVYVVSSCLRGFTLIPSTFLLLAGLPFFAPLPLYVMTMIGIAVSAASLYGFSHLCGIDRLLEHRYPERLARIRAALRRNQFAIVFGASFFPFLPTDLVCYACGTLRTGFKRFMLAVLLGEGLIVAAYVFVGDRVLELLQLR